MDVKPTERLSFESFLASYGGEGSSCDSTCLLFQLPTARLILSDLEGETFFHLTIAGLTCSIM